jgi:flagellar hook-associated protein 1
MQPKEHNMQSTFAGIEIGKRSLVAHTTGLTTIGHNLSNASVEGYSRQRVQLGAFDPIYVPGLNREAAPGQIGQGVSVESVERVHDQILQGRIISQANGQGYWEARDKYLLMVEQVYNEPAETSLRSHMDQFWEAWQDLAMRPEENASRQAVVHRGRTLVGSIQNQYRGLKDIRDMLELEVSATVDQVNGILRDISNLNEQIVKVKAMGDNPNDLLDRRDLLTKELSGLMDITIDNRDPDEFTITTGGFHLIQGRVVSSMTAESDPLNEGYSTVKWSLNGDDVYLLGGKLASYVNLRDNDLRSEIQNLDMMSINFIDLVNENHKAAYGLNGKTGIDFFDEYPIVNNVAGNYDTTGDGAFDSTYLFRINGNNVLDGGEQIGLQGTMQLSGPNGNIPVEYFPTDSVNDIVKRINLSGSEVVARLDRNGYLQLKASPAAQKENPDFIIRHIEDDGQFLSGYAGILITSGAEGAYDFGQADAVTSLRGEGLHYSVAPVPHPSGWLEVNQTLINDPGSIAAGFGVNGHISNPGDGSAAISIASLRNNDVMVGRLRSFDEYFSSTVANAGLKGEAAARALETEDLIMKDLESMRESISGVNIDEELAQMIKFQHGYSAASRYVSEVNKMLDTIINRMGV